MSNDEVIATFVSVVLCIWLWPRWLWQVARVTHIGPYPPCRRWPLYLTPVLAGIGLLAVLLTVSSPDVRTSVVYTFMYTVMGLAWVACAMKLFPFLNMDVLGDCLERGNEAALAPALAAMLGVMLTFSGANIGSGPGWWVVIFCGVLATGGLLAFWFLLELVAAPSELITVDRDRLAGWRMAGYLTAQAILLSRAVAGDWISTSSTLHDFVIKSGACWLLLLLAITVESTASRGNLPAWVGKAVAVIYPGFAIIIVVLEGVPK